MSKYTCDYRPRVDEITDAKIQRLARAFNKKPNVLLREFTEAATKMIEYVQRHPEILGDFDFHDISPEKLLWKASEARQLVKDKPEDTENKVA